MWFWSDIVTDAARRAGAVPRAAGVSYRNGHIVMGAAGAPVDVAATWAERFSLGRPGSTSRGAPLVRVRVRVRET